MKRIIDSLKVLWADERGRALLKLSVYLIFMVFVVLYTRMLVRESNLNENSLKTSYEKFINQIDYTADVNVGDEKISLIGGNITSFSFDGQDYVVVDSKLLKNQIEVNDFTIYFWKITPKFIGKVLENKEPEYTSNYKDGLIKKGYKISLKDFLENYNISNINVGDIENIPEDYIEIIIEDTGVKIELVTLNLDSYYRFVTGENKNFSIEIKY